MSIFRVKNGQLERKDAAAASQISFDNSGTGLSAANVQSAITEINSGLANYFPRSEQRVLGAKNWLENKATNVTKDNVVFTIDSNGIITANGTAASPPVQYATVSITGGVIPNIFKGLLLNGCIGGSASTFNYNVAYFNTQTGTQVHNDITSVDYTIKNYDYINIFARVVAGAAVTNAKWEPMISFDGGTFAPYAMTNRELTEGFIKCSKYNLSYTTSTISKNTQMVQISISESRSQIIAMWVDTGSTNDRGSCNYVDADKKAYVLITNEMGHGSELPMAGYLYVLYI